jgi:hypothetical protein
MISPPKKPQRDKHIQPPRPSTRPSEQEVRYHAADRAILERLLGNLNNPLDLAYDTRIDFVTVAGDMTRNLPPCKATDGERLELVCALRWRWNKYTRLFESRYIKPPRTTNA